MICNIRLIDRGREAGGEFNLVWYDKKYNIYLQCPVPSTHPPHLFQIGGGGVIKYVALIRTFTRNNDF